MEQIRTASDYIKRLLEDKKDVKSQYTVSETKTREITLENGEFTLFRTLFDRKVSIGVIKDQKPGTISTNSFEEEALKEALEGAITSSESGTAEEYFDIAGGMDPAEFEIGVLEADIDGLMKRALEFKEEVEKNYKKILLMQVILKHVKKDVLYRNTNGSEDTTRMGEYEVMVEFAGNDGTNTTGICGTMASFKDLNTPLIELGSIKRELENAEKSLNPIPVSGKFEGQVIFTPECFAQMLGYSLGVLTTDAVILDGTSQWKDKIGEKVVSEKLTLSMEPWNDDIITNEVHTGDGFRSENYTVLDEGVLKSFCVSLYTSNKCKVERAKNSSMDMIVKAGDTSFEDMVKAVKKGLIVGSISCGRPSTNAELSGVAKNAFYVEDGEIKGAVNETMVSFNLVEMLNKISMVSKERLKDGTMVVPYVCADGILISGQ
ncbi:MAG: TldD/PmbA family protein [Lachnospiraceae bacterium]|nr:TldD/PmbA family protein [Lachnospiraceae bacterium]